MKKKWIMFVGLIIFLFGCVKKTVTYDFAKLRESLQEFFPDAEVLEIEMFEKKFDVDTTNMEDALIFMPTMANNADMLIFVKPKDGKQGEAKKEIDSLFDYFLNQYGMYYPEEYEKIKEKTYKEQDGYLIYLVSNQKKEILQVIEENKDGVS